jgi:AcrR family transcriptional regulator
MAEIAQAAGVGKGTLYRRFSNKGELCLGLMNERLQAFQDKQLAQMRAMSAAGTPYLEQLAQFLEALVTFTAAHMPLLCEVQQHSQSLDEEQVERPHFWQYMTVHGLLHRARRAAEVRADLDAAYTAEALLAPLNADTFRFQLEQLDFTQERIQAGLRTLVQALHANSQ